MPRDMYVSYRIHNMARDTDTRLEKPQVTYQIFEFMKSNHEFMGGPMGELQCNNTVTVDIHIHIYIIWYYHVIYDVTKLQARFTAEPYGFSSLKLGSGLFWRVLNSNTMSKTGYSDPFQLPVQVILPSPQLSTVMGHIPTIARSAIHRSETKFGFSKKYGKRNGFFWQSIFRFVVTESLQKAPSPEIQAIEEFGRDPLFIRLKTLLHRTGRASCR